VARRSTSTGAEFQLRRAESKGPAADHLGPISPAGTDTLHLITGGGVTQSSPLLVTNLAVTSDGDVRLNLSNNGANDGGNQFRELGVATSGGFVNIYSEHSEGLTIGAVDGVAGLSAGGGSVSVTVSGQVFVADTPASHDLFATSTISIVSHAAEGQLSIAEGAHIHSSGGTHSYTANRIDIQGTISAPGQRVIPRPLQNFQRIDLGSTGDSAINTLELSDAELDRITAAILQVGMSTSTAPIVIRADITRPDATDIELYTTGAVIFDPGSLDTAGGSLLLAPGAGGVQPLSAGVDITADTVSFASTLHIVINGTTLDAEYAQLNVEGTVDLSGVDLALSGSYVPVNADVFTIVSATSVTGQFHGLAEGDEVMFGGEPLTVNYTATGVTLTANLNSPPVADAGGPYAVDEGAPLTLDASASSDPDELTAGFTYAIDWDGDGTVDQVVAGSDMHELEYAFEAMGTYVVTVTATDKDGGTSATATHTVEIAAAVVDNDGNLIAGGGTNTFEADDNSATDDADPPQVIVTPVAAGNEKTPIPLTIWAGLSDTDGSESLSVQITGVPEFAVLSSGTKNADGSWTLTTAETSINLTGMTGDYMTNLEVAHFYKDLFKRNSRTAPGGPPKLDAQVLAVAMSTYITRQSLVEFDYGNNMVNNTLVADVQSFGFVVTVGGVGSTFVNVGDSGAAFDVADDSEVQIIDLLLAVNDWSSNGLLYDLNDDGEIDETEELYRMMANDVFSRINEM
jgi:hypothetical protein